MPEQLGHTDVRNQQDAVIAGFDVHPAADGRKRDPSDRRDGAGSGESGALAGLGIRTVGDCLQPRTETA